MLEDLYRKIGDIPMYAERNKIYRNYHEINKQKKQYIDAVQWNADQEKEYNDFWKKYYGYIPNVKFNKYYESINGMYNYQYIPRPLYDCVIEPRINPYRICRIFENKNLQYSLFKGIDELKIPKTFAKRDNGIFVVNDMICPINELIIQCRNIGECIIKPTMWTSGGKNVRLINIVDGKDVFTGEDLEQIVRSYGIDFVIQEKINPSKELREISPNSLNTFRVSTFIFKGEIHCCPVAFRVGVGDSITDNESAGGYAIGVKDDGKLRKTAYNYESETENKYLYIEEQPDTNTTFENYYIGDIEKIKWVAKKMHSMIPMLGIVSWDLSIDEGGNIVLVELNAQYQGIDLNQVANGEPLFGEKTGEYLKQFYRARKI